jgi:hypothetical protein
MAKHNSAFSNRLLYPTSKKIFTTFEINRASGFGCLASVSPIAKGAKRYAQEHRNLASNFGEIGKL